MPAFPFDFELPADLIAQTPCEPRDQARLLVLGRGAGALAHRRVADLPALLDPGDLLVFNDTRVVPARLVGKRARTGGKWEGLFLRLLPEGAWEMLSQTRGRLTAGEWVDIEPGPLRLRLEERLTDGRWRARPDSEAAWVDLLERHGRVPLPPYIRKGIADEADRSHYQTVYASAPGAVAAPTAGLHFTPALLERLEARSIERAFVTLHVGLGTFRPIETADYRDHPMHAEWGCLSPAAAAAISAARERGSRVVAVGTTTVRVLESAALQQGRSPRLEAWSGETRLFIYPPYVFRVVDAMFTNFHLPRSTLLLLVCAFAGAVAHASGSDGGTQASATKGVSLIEGAYRTAMAAGYRFFSYGDAMLIL